MKTISIAIDGPSGAGKSTLAKSVSKTLGYLYVDTGAIYRTIGYAAFSKGVDPKDGEAAAALLPELEIGLHYGEDGLQHMTLNGADVTDQIRLPEISLYASAVSAHPAVRAHLLEMQRKLARENNVVMDGRDIGTVVLPDATVKIFLTASVEERAMRRFRELEQRGTPESYEKVLEEMRQRDYNDSHRAAAPLRQAEDAVLLDTTELDFQQSEEAILPDHPREDEPMNETRTTQPFGPFFPLIFTVAKWICRLLHPVTVQGLENLPRHGALLVAQSRQQLGPSGAGNGTAHGLPASRHGQGGTVPESHSGMGHPGGGRIPGEPGRRGHSGGENRHPDHSERPQSADLPGGHHHPERHRQGRRPAGPRPQRRGGDRRPHRRHSGAGVRGWRKADLPPDTHHHRPALYAGIYRPPGDCGGDAEHRG